MCGRNNLCGASGRMVRCHARGHNLSGGQIGHNTHCDGGEPQPRWDCTPHGGCCLCRRHIRRYVGIQGDEDDPCQESYRTGPLYGYRSPCRGHDHHYGARQLPLRSMVVARTDAQRTPHGSAHPHNPRPDGLRGLTAVGEHLGVCGYALDERAPGVLVVDTAAIMAQAVAHDEIAHLKHNIIAYYLVEYLARNPH